MTGSALSVYFVLPGDVDDETVPSGGNAYDRRVCAGLAALGWRVARVRVTGTWPRPDAGGRLALAKALAALPDGALVLVDGLVGCGVPEALVPEADRLRLVPVVHMPLADEVGIAPEVAADLDARERRTLHAATAVVATSAWSADRLATHHGLPMAKVRVAAPGTDPAPVATESATGSRLLCVAALTPGKGQDVLVQALAEVADLPWTCALVGSTSRDPEFAGLVSAGIERHGLGERVRLAGPLAGDRLAAEYADADLLVLASRTETFGMVVTEALARAVPVLATRVGALPDTLGSSAGVVPGLLVPAADPAALAGALRRWLTDDPLRRDARSAALRRRAELPGWADTALAVARVLREPVGSA